MRLIDADALIESLSINPEDCPGCPEPEWLEELACVLALAPTVDAIDRQAAIDGADAIIARDTSGNNDVVKAMTAWKRYVEALPSAQPEKKGKWVKLYDGSFHCRLCGHTFTVIQGENSMNFCPNCGAEMRGDPNV